MKARIAELRDKQVVSIKDASVVGHVYDIEFDTETGSLCSIVVTGKSKGLTFLGRGEDIVIPWDKIEVIGNDSILISLEGYLPNQRKRRGALSGLFYGD
ncbi:MAG: YlmC/YmxH family sporulation protein [Acutalibacteraceae bacterium]|nr:YlmC/YmxH family sporulation protein [Acutalibacteraceae bacterium]